MKSQWHAKKLKLHNNQKAIRESKNSIFDKCPFYNQPIIPKGTRAIHFVRISSSISSGLWYRNQRLHTQWNQQINTPHKEPPNSNQTLIKLTSRLTAKIGQCLPIISCQTVLDWNFSNLKITWDEESRNQFASQSDKRWRELRRGIAPFDSWGLCLRIDKRVSSVALNSVEAESTPPLEIWFWKFPPWRRRWPMATNFGLRHDINWLALLLRDGSICRDVVLICLFFRSVQYFHEFLLFKKWNIRFFVREKYSWNTPNMQLYHILFPLF